MSLRLLCALLLTGCSCSHAMDARDAGGVDADTIDALATDAAFDAPDAEPMDVGLDAPDAPIVELDGGPLPPIRYLTCAEAAAQRSYLGCDYWPASTPNNVIDPARFSFAVAIANPNMTDVSIHIDGGALTAPRDFVVTPGNTHTEILPWVESLAQASTTGLSAGAAYHLESDLPVAVYQFSPLEYTDGLGTDPSHLSWSNDASLLLPSTALGTTYRALTWPTDTGGSAGTITVVATAPGETTIDIVLADRTRDLDSAYPSSPGSTLTTTLAQGDTFLVMSGHPLDTGGCGTLADLTGSTIEASQPVAVFVGHQCTSVPCDVLYCDHLEEQLFPTRTWGRDYVVSALRERGDTEPSVIRILSAEDGNALTFDGIPRPSECPPVLGAGEFCELTTTEDFMLRGSRPMLVAQFMVGQDLIAGTSGGDPAMVLEVPIFQFRTDYVIVVPETYVENFVTIVHRNGLPPVMDGTPVPLGAPVGSSGFSATRFSVTPGTHRLRGTAFGVKVSGVAPYTSYVYPGGLDLATNPF